MLKEQKSQDAGFACARAEQPSRRAAAQWAATLACLLTSTALVRPAQASEACASLLSLNIPDVAITSAADEAPGFVPPTAGTPAVPQAFCRVVAVATPTGSSGINFEVWLPVVTAWNQKFRAEGSGGSAGSLSYPAMEDGLARGYATVSQDNGHIGSSWTFSQNPYSVVDFGYRAEHVTTVAAKAIVAAYYEQAPTHSYYLGCSQGGHHGDMEVQRYPEDFDGIIAGSSGQDWTGLMVDEVWTGYWSSVAGPQFDLPQPQLDLVTAAVVKSCGTQASGLSTNGWLNDPRACRFDPAVLQCTDGQDPSTCLTGQRVSAVQRIYEGPRDPVTFQQLAAPLMRGGETAWRQFLVGGTQPGGSSLSFWRDGVFDDPNYDFKTFNFHTDVLQMQQKTFAGQTLPEILDAVDPDLEAFHARGGKLISYHGWADPFVSPLTSVFYYQNVVADQGSRHGLHSKRAALAATKDFARLFMVPGMFHCAGGPGANAFGSVGQPVTPATQDPQHDIMRALEHWVEDGVAPDQIIATKYNDDLPANGAAFSRPLCTYPKVAEWNGAGSDQDASNYACVNASAQRNGPEPEDFVQAATQAGR
jgi:feruloyl esterase